MADWSHPTINDGYLSILGVDSAHGYMCLRDIDLATMFSDLLPAATNIPTGTIRFNRTLAQFEEWNTNVPNGWSVIGPIDIAMGGTGGNTQSAAQTSLGLGTLALQNANSVNITGGTITGVQFLTPLKVQVPVGVDLF